MGKKEIIKTDKAPTPVGPYSMATVYGNLIFTAGQLGLDPATGNLIEGGVEAETRRALTNIKNILESVGVSMDHVLKTTVYLRDISDFAKMNAVYAEFFTEPYPARTTVQVGALPRNVAIEIDAIAYRE